MKEVFKDIKGFEGLYQISNQANVKSLERKDRLGRMVKGRILKHKIDTDGYHQVNLCKNGIVYTKKVHRLVAQAFIPNPDGKATVNHKDANKSHNYDINLEWATSYENNLHASKHGLGVAFRKGESHPSVKLTAKKVKEIRKSNLSTKELSKKYEVSYGTVYDIINRRTWKHI